MALVTAMGPMVSATLSSAPAPDRVRWRYALDAWAPNAAMARASSFTLRKRFSRSRSAGLLACGRDLCVRSDEW